jgi:hypothetical protein
MQSAYSKKEAYPSENDAYDAEPNADTHNYLWMAHTRTQLPVPFVMRTVECLDFQAVLSLSFKRLPGRKLGAIPVAHHQRRSKAIVLFLVFLDFDFEPGSLVLVVTPQKIWFDLERLTKNTSTAAVFSVSDFNDASRRRLLFFKPDEAFRYVFVQGCV